MFKLNLLDLIELFCDWKASTLRHNDGNIKKSIEINQNRFGYDDILKSTNEINQAKIVNQSKVDELSNLINYEQELKNKSLGFEKIFEVRTAKLNIYKEEYEKQCYKQNHYNNNY